MIRRLLLPLTLAVLTDMAVAAPFSLEIEDASSAYMPATDVDEVALLRAVIRTESNFNPYAVSPVGAQGLAQFMPETWAEVATRLGIPEASPYEVVPAITGAAFYLSDLYSKWTEPRTDRDRWSLALASYNAGLGNTLKAQERCGGCTAFADIAPHLSAITGSNAQETLTYVNRVWSHYDGR